MKKIITFILLFALTLSTFVGCKNDDGFEDVVSVTYTVDGQKKTEKSTAYMSLGVANVEYISEEGIQMNFSFSKMGLGGYSNLGVILQKIDSKGLNIIE